MNKNLFLKIGFVIVSFSVLLLWLYFIIENKIFGIPLGLLFTIMFGSSLLKIYIKLFEEDIFTQYLYLFLIIPIVVFTFILNKNNKIEKKEMMIFQRNFIKNKINSMLDKYSVINSLCYFL